MQTREMSWKSKVVYIVAVCLMTLLIWLGDEGKSPLVYKGSELQHSVGAVDSEYALVIRDAVARNGTVANTLQYVINKGGYTAQLHYLAETEGSTLELWEQGRKIAGWTLDPDKTEMTVDFSLSKDVKQLQIKINYSGSGELTIRELRLSPHTMFYADTYFFMALFLACSILLWWYLNRSEKRLDERQLVDYGLNGYTLEQGGEMYAVSCRVRRCGFGMRGSGEADPGGIGAGGDRRGCEAVFCGPGSAGGRGGV